MTMTERLYTLRRLPIFAGLGEAELLLLAEVTRLKTFAAGATIYSEGDTAAKLYVVFSGTATFEDGSVVPDAFDIASLLYGKPVGRRIQVSKDSPLLCMSITKGQFFTLMNECPVILLNVLRPSDEGMSAGRFA